MSHQPSPFRSCLGTKVGNGRFTSVNQARTFVNELLTVIFTSK